MLTYYQPFSDQYLESVITSGQRARDMRRELQRTRAKGSTISRKEYEGRKQARKMAKASQRQQRRVH